MKARKNIQLIDSIGGRSVETLTSTEFDKISVAVVLGNYCHTSLAYTLPGSLIN